MNSQQEYFYNLPMESIYESVFLKMCNSNGDLEEFFNGIKTFCIKNSDYEKADLFREAVKDYKRLPKLIENL